MLLLDTHQTSFKKPKKEWLCMQDPRYGRTREELLHESYLEGAEGGGAGQSDHGFRVAFQSRRKIRIRKIRNGE